MGITGKNTFNRRISIWKGSLLLFGLLIAIVLAYFLWQIHQLQQVFFKSSLDHSKILANVVERNAQNALISQDAVEKIIRIFLGNTARFVDYLDAVEPFSDQELSEFATESGLAGIRIVRENGLYSQGPPNWIPVQHIHCQSESGILRHLPADHLFLLPLAGKETHACIITGFPAVQIETLRESISLSHLIDSLSNLPGIEYIRVDAMKDHEKLTDFPSVTFNLYNNERVAETRVCFGRDVLVLGIETRHFQSRTRQLWHEFFFFSSVLACIGIFFSWILYWNQSRYLNQIKSVERELARQREDAALGRAAAAITHEIRNPLNAIGMGLQRLQIEVDDLPDEYMQLISDMMKAVSRTNAIVTDIRQFAIPLTPQKQKIRMGEVIAHILNLYAAKLADQGIVVKNKLVHDPEIDSDMKMMEQVMENLIKNAIEAQPKGGYIALISNESNQYLYLSVENAGFDADIEGIIEPYFTTKTRGTGLGLSIVKKIIAAHGGQFEIESPDPGILRITIILDK